MRIYSGSSIILLVIVLVPYDVKGHPQCLDFTSPFNFPADHELPFCRYVRLEGCCNDTTLIEQQHARIKTLVIAESPELWENCGHYVQDYLCQQCSPYAAHIFDMEILQNETNPIPRAFPGLCKTNCLDFQNTCRDLVFYYLRGAGEQFDEELKMYTSVKDEVDGFCKVNKPSATSYCYPWLINNMKLIGPKPIELSRNKNCMCLQRYDNMEPLLSDHPIFLVNAGDGTDRMFVGEQRGRVYILYPNGTVHQGHFLDVRENVEVSNTLWDERGLLGMAFHPNFVNNSKFYIFYATPLNEQDDQSLSHKMRLEEWQVSTNNPNLADRTTRKVILEINEPYSNHNGGQILFGDDGYLYVLVGDGGSAGDPENYAQNLFSLLGKALRIDVNRPDNIRGKQYSIPPDNPFADGLKGLPEIYAYGLRNPWRCGIDRGDPVTGEAEKPLTEPIYSYSHSVGKSITGGQFYRGRDSPSLNGQYIYGDYDNGQLYSLMYNESTNTWSNKKVTLCTADLCPSPLTNNYSSFILSFGQDERGEVYLLSASYPSLNSLQGSIYKLVEPVRESSGAETICQSGFQSIVVIVLAALNLLLTFL